MPNPATRPNADHGQSSDGSNSSLPAPSLVPRALHRAATALVVGTLLAASHRLAAHETWLLPATFTAPAAQSLEFSLTSGMAFPALDSGIDRRRVSEAVLLQGDDEQTMVPVGGREGELLLSAIPGSGVACAWVRLRPRILEIDEPEDVEHYLEEIGAPQAVWSAWSEARGQITWRESYSKLARSYLVGDGEVGDDIRPCWRETSGARFDILPMADPTALQAGDSLELQLVFDGEPLADQAVGLVREGEQSGELVRSDAAGRVTITTGAGGRHMVHGTYLRRVNGDGFGWESDFTTLTFSVVAARRPGG